MLLAGAKTVLIWDRLQAHRSKSVRDYLAEHGITVVLLPGYSPQIKPTEWLWANLKDTESTNYCPEDIKDVEHETRRGIKRIRRKIPLLTGFFTGAGLFFWVRMTTYMGNFRNVVWVKDVKRFDGGTPFVPGLRGPKCPFPGGCD